MMNRNILMKHSKNFINLLTSNNKKFKFSLGFAKHNNNFSFTYTPKNFFSILEETESDGKFFNSMKIIKSKASSIYDLKQTKSNDSALADEDEKPKSKPLEESLFNLEEIESDLSKFLKSLELARSYDIKLSKYADVKKHIPILNKDDVKSSLFGILSDPKILSKNINELLSNVSESVKASQSYESLLDKAYYDKVVEVLLMTGKFFLSNNIYAVDHTLNLKIKNNKDLVMQLADVKILLEFLNLSDLNNEQLISIFPIVIMLNNIYNVTEIVMEKLFNETINRLLNPFNKIISTDTEELLKSYLMFIIVNNFISKSTTYLHHLIIYKDIILKNNDINDLTYLITENIFKFINLNKNASSVELKTQILLFEEFLCSYLNSYNVIEVTNRLNANEEIVQNFLYSLLLLKEFNFNLKEENQFLSNDSVKSIKLFIEEGIFNLSSPKVFENININKILVKDNSLFLLSGIENKLFSLLDDKLNANNRVLNLFAVNDNLMRYEASKISFEKLKLIIFNAERHYTPLSAYKKIIQSLCEGLSIKILNKSLSIEEIIKLLDNCGKYSVKETKKIYENLSDKINKLIRNDKFSVKNTVDLLHIIAKYNLIDVYENNPLYVQFLLKFKEETISDPEIANDLPKLVWTLSSFALRSKEFTPIFHFAINNLITFLNKITTDYKNLSTEDLKYILQSLSVVEQMMKYNLTNVDLRETFNSELISSLLNLYLSRTQSIDTTSLKANYIKGILGQESGNYNNIIKNYTNVFIGYELVYKGKNIPIIFITSEDVNIDGKLLGEDYINYHHLKSFYNVPPMILDINTISCRHDFEKEYQFYSKHSKTGYKKYLD